MRRIIAFLVGLVSIAGAIQALGQTPNPLPVTGNLQSILGAGVQYAGVSVQLQNCASPVSITGYSVIVQQQYQVQANGSGLVNFTLWPNNLIDCNGTTGNSQYMVTYVVSGVPQGTPQCYQVVSTQGSWNLNVQQPVTCGTSPPNPTDGQFTNLNVTGILSASKAITDLERNGAHWFDVRSCGAVPDGKYLGSSSPPYTSGTDSTAAFVSCLVTLGASGLAPIGGSEMQIPAAPYQGGLGGGPTGTDAFFRVMPGQLIIPSVSYLYTIEGRGKLTSTIWDETNNASPTAAPGPLLTIGDNNTALQSSTDMRSFTLVGAPNDEFPTGILSFLSDNISTMDNMGVMIGTNAPGSIGVNLNTGNFEGEMKFQNLSITGQGNANVMGTTGIKIGPGTPATGLAASVGNFDFVDSNIENVTNAVDCSGANGWTPSVTWTHGHMERIDQYGSFSFYAHPCVLHVFGLDMASGSIYLDTSTVGSEISLGPSRPDYPAVYIDNGVGNKFTQTSSAPYSSATLRLNGDEQYKTASAYSDPQFINFSYSEWLTTNASNIGLNPYGWTAPAAAQGESIQVLSTNLWTSADYVYTVFPVAPSTDYELVAVVPFTHSSDPAPTISVYDVASSTVIYTTTVTPTNGVPAGSDQWAYATVRAWIPASSGATNWQVRFNTSAASKTFYVQYLGVNPSSMTQASHVIVGTGTCSGDGAVGATCTIPGEDGGGTTNTVTWTPSMAPLFNGGAFVRFHIVTSASAGSPECSLGGTTPVYFPAGISLDYNVPLGYFPTTVSCSDRAGASATTNDMVLSQVSVVAMPYLPSGDFANALNVYQTQPANLAALSNLNANNLNSASLINPGFLLYKGLNPGYEAGCMAGQQNGQGAATCFMPNSGSFQLCFYTAGTEQTSQSGWSCPFLIVATGPFIASGKMSFASGVGFQFFGSAPAVTAMTSTSSGATALVNAPPSGGTAATYPGGDGLWHTTVNVGTPTLNQAACIKAVGPPVVIGYCSTVVSSSGACTCN